MFLNTLFNDENELKNNDDNIEQQSFEISKEESDRQYKLSLKN